MMNQTKSDHPFYTVGVTGGIGCGKSSVCQILKELGCEIFNADQAAKTLQEEDHEVIEGLKQLFGNDINISTTPERFVPDRKRIASIVFQDKAKLDAINRLIHPKVFKAFDDAKTEAMKRGVQILVKEAAILFEAGGVKGLDKVIVVAAEIEKRIARVQRSSGLSEAAVRARMANQWPQEKLIEKADFVIYNNGSIEQLRLHTKDVLHKILEPVIT